jgi:transposase, IS5 family
MRTLIKPQLDLFFQWPNHYLGRELKKISEILDRHPEFAQWVHVDLTENKISTGNVGMSSDQVLRAAVIKNIRKLSYEELAFNIADSKSTRAFMMLEVDENYSASCLQETVSKISEETWKNISRELVFDAREGGFEDCKIVRVDSTVTDTHIGYPTDSKLLYDCIRVIDREFKRARIFACKKSWRLTSTEQVKTAKSLRYKINNSKNDEQRLPHYKELLKIAKSIKAELPSMIVKIEKVFEKKKKKWHLEKPLEQLQNVDFYLEKVIYQAEKRVIKGQTVPVHKKIVSIFESHTDIIVKDRRDTQFGHKIFVTSGKSNMVLHCDIPRGNPADSEMFLPTLNSLQNSYDMLPRKVSSDGGFASQDNVTESKKMGVKDVCFPKTCNMKITDMVKSSWVYKNLLNWRAGIEAVISFLKRCFGLSRATWSGFTGYKRYIRSGVTAYNLVVLARLELSVT